MKNNKLYSLALSIAIAFGLWLYVVTNVSQEAEQTFYNIPVVMEGESVLTDRNLMITSVSNQTIALTLSGSRSDLGKVNSSNITVKVDLSKIYEPGVNLALKPSITYPGDVASNAFVEESRSPSYIHINVDTRRTKEVPVVIHWTGTRSGDYIYDTENAVLDFTAITVSGPAEVADKIDHAQIQVDLTDQVESLSESFRYTLCDENGEPVDAHMIVTNVEEVRVDLKVQRIKEVLLMADVIYGGGATDQNTLVTVDPGMIRLSGSDAILEELGDTYTVATINLAELEKSQELKYGIALPEGVINQSGVTEALVAIRFSGLSVREFQLSEIRMVNVPEGMEAEIINSSLTVKVRGPASEISLLTAADITATVDFSAAEAGNATYKVKLQFGEAYSGVGALNTYSVPATVRAAEE